MRIFLCGAAGFLGRHLYQALTQAGHEVVRGVRTPHLSNDMKINYSHDVDVNTWLPRLQGMDVVINAVGILSETKEETFDAIHRDAPMALFEAAQKSGISRIIQISALSHADSTAMTPYMRTKYEADHYLQRLAINWTILRPSLLVGLDGSSSQFFRTLASMPVIGLPGKGEQLLQPVHIQDVCDAVVALLSSSAMSQQIMEVVGKEVMSYRTMLLRYREAMDLPPPWWIPIPMFFMHTAAKIAGYLPQRVLTSDTLYMLEQGNTGDPTALTQIIGKEPMPSNTWFAHVPSTMLRAEAILNWTQPLFRLILALIWIITGCLSLGIYPVEKSYQLLHMMGLDGILAAVVLYGASLLDIVLGVATLLMPSRALWRIQFTMILFYMGIITWFMPLYWLHPFGPILKNIALLGLLLPLHALERE